MCLRIILSMVFIRWEVKATGRKWPGFMGFADFGTGTTQKPSTEQELSPESCSGSRCGWPPHRAGLHSPLTLWSWCHQGLWLSSPWASPFYFYISNFNSLSWAWKKGCTLWGWYIRYTAKASHTVITHVNFCFIRLAYLWYIFTIYIYHRYTNI